ncbi:hypothetical protein HS088_TW21G00163 [Tripterygium wilfordii]|uniref:Beta-glucosidase 18-like n=1 Tax=Tripterygium wilfordii TaxID=458696 RepID=A0A7J7C1N8_TRIWF|nr:beta-glucosidase 18-like isoform X1 [Tripterygium wilfordii]KAF5728021.1 hypothetical protein HS088_TW21G00163 [Tripterygium wilfordii]
MGVTILRLLLLSFIVLFPSLSFAHGFGGSGEENVKRSDFPDGFLFGTGTSSYQVEGAYLEDGKGLSNWDVFAHIPGNIVNNDNGDVADDHYHRFLEDIDLIHSLGTNAHRLSISWSRILPRGRFGEVNPSGIKFYNKIIDNLLSKGIEPFVTLHHQDLPQELQDRYQSWLSSQMQEDFVYFAEICFKNFGDRVKYWATINEPNLSADFSYLKGLYPPGHCSAPFGNCSEGNSDVEPLIVMHNMLLAHAKAVRLYRELFQPTQGGSIGIVTYSSIYEPLRDDEADRQAVSRALAFNIAWVLDPLIHGDYPQEMCHYLGSSLPSFSLEEVEYVKGSIDFIGINHYETLYIKDCIYSACPSGYDHPIRGFIYTTGERDGVPIGERTAIPSFFIVPRGMEKIVDYIKERYNNSPMFVTENGYAPPKQQDEQLQDLLLDVKRISYHKAYLAALARVIRNGADVRGYFLWCLMDNLEWKNGYTMRFGLYYVDRQTLQRMPKLSAKWYSDFLTNGTSQHVSSFKNKNFLLTWAGI